MTLDLRISLSKLELFCLAAELQSFGRAAEQSFITQPVMTAHMRSLSERLGADLFVRDGNRMVLTQEGRVAYDWARDALARARTTVRQLEQIQDGTRGSVVIPASNAIGSYILPTIVAHFKFAHPDVDVTVLIPEFESAVRAVEIGERDFALTMAFPEVLRRSAASFEEIGQEELILVGPDAQDIEEPLLSRGISQRDILAFPQGSFSRCLADWFLAESGISELRAFMELGSTEAIKRAVRCGLGLAFLFRSSVSDELERGELHEYKIAGTRTIVPIYLMRRHDYSLAPLERRLLSSVREALVQRDSAVNVAAIA